MIQYNTVAHRTRCRQKEFANTILLIRVFFVSPLIGVKMHFRQHLVIPHGGPFCRARTLRLARVCRVVRTERRHQQPVRVSRRRPRSMARRWMLANMQRTRRN